MRHYTNDIGILKRHNILVLFTQSCLTLCDPKDWSPPGFPVRGIIQAKILEWVAISFSRGSSRPRDQTLLSCIAGRLFTDWATREALINLLNAYQFIGWKVKLHCFISIHCFITFSCISYTFFVRLKLKLLITRVWINKVCILIYNSFIYIIILYIYKTLCIVTEQHFKHRAIFKHSTSKFRYLVHGSQGSRTHSCSVP